MRKIAGFYRVSELADNAIGAVATFGEIDRQRLTYSKEERNFKYAECPKTELVTMQVIDENNTPVVTTTAVTKRTVEVGEWLVTQHLAGLVPSEAARDKFYAALVTEFADLDWVGMGALIRSAQNSYYMPTHVEYVLKDSSYEYLVKVWMAGENFAEEYEPFEIHIIPPLDNIDLFINNTITVSGLLQGNTPKRVLDIYNGLRGDNPVTRLDTYDLTHHDPSDSASRINTTWSYLAYGIKGTNVDNIKAAIRNVLANESTYDKWPDIFPALYAESDFTIIPWWDSIAVPATNTDQNLYASYITLKGQADRAKQLVPTGYGNVEVVGKHIDNNLEVVSTFYRGMMLGCIGNPSNLNKQIKLSMLYPDYTNEAPSSPDFERMEQDTRDFAEQLAVGLEIARRLKDSDTVPAGFVRTRRDNMVYLTFIHRDFQFMIMTRNSYFEKLKLKV